MRKYYTFILAFWALSISAISFAGNPENGYDPHEVTFVKPGNDQLDPVFQANLRQLPAWQSFLDEHGNWYVHFNESNQKPHRAFGQPIAVSGATAEEQAWSFVETQLEDFNIPLDELVISGVVSTKKHKWVNFSQVHNGYEIFSSRLAVKLTHSGEVILFGLDVHPQIDFEEPSLSASEALSAATSGIGYEIISTEAVGPMQLLPIPKNRSYEYHSVYDIMVKSMNENGIPANYRTFVDAVTGDVLYRQNTVHHHTENCSNHCDEEEAEDETPAVVDAEIEIFGTLHPLNPFDGEEQISLGDLSVTLGGQEYFTEPEGGLSLSASSGTINVPLSGRWSTVINNGNTPSLSTTISDGFNNISFDNDADIGELTAFHHVNVVHNFMKEQLQGFTALDFSMPTNVEVAGECNAFYDGQSVNFFSEGGGCNATSLLADVVYHEYGHGINGYFYNDNGWNFNNGAMNEGYADFWGMAITQSPLLGVGFYTANEQPLRRYDINPKVYPVDLIGQVHNDGEIICGAWWDSHVLMGENWDLTLDLWVEAYSGFQAVAANGLEGTAYTDVLIDVLQADDDDNDISNGTPNGDAILEGFAIHGISLLSNVNIYHEQVLASESQEEIEITAELDSQYDFEMFLQEVSLFYRTDVNADFSSVEMSEIGETSVYSALIPGQEEGTLIEYYLQAEDVFGTQSNATPVGVTQDDPTLAYFTLVGFSTVAFHDSDFGDDFGFWDTGLPSDNATTGIWEDVIPVGSFTDNNMEVAPANQFTDGGAYCFVTQNGSSPFDAIGAADVDGGKTTLRSPVIDLSIYERPAISYWRWYTNSPPSGANPGQDWWEVRISDDGGDTWTHVEETRTTDAQWRQNAFIVGDYIDLTDQVMMEFIASDSIFPELDLEGGSLVEAAVDDFYLYETTGNVGIEENTADFGFTAYPNPASEQVFVNVSTKTESDGELTMVNMLGEQVYGEQVHFHSGSNTYKIPLSKLSAGIYLIRVKTEGGLKTKKVTVK